ncbi:hypothetical protein SynRS9902_02088 [Synechococcus sp. RS9902]|nr:hypothetical protein SynRS9902_02088 [Synechococcus sp. RS9902]
MFAQFLLFICMLFIHLGSVIQPVLTCRGVSMPIDLGF